jgi:hypothetical protein
VCDIYIERDREEGRRSFVIEKEKCEIYKQELERDENRERVLR